MPLDTSRQPGPVLFGSESFKAGLISALIAGSIVLGGNMYTERGQNTTPMQKLGTGAYMTYTDAVCSNTGGLTKYTSCLIANPFTGTGLIARIQVDSNKAPTGSKITCTTTTIGSTTATGGNVLIRYATTASGSSVFAAPSGSGSAVVAYTPPPLLPGASIRCWHSTTPGPGLKEQLRVWLNEQYVP